ncbi:MAG: hypothetical protein FJ224_01800 [Lentisphaerae bacterium]|nr:hypothetical protein [Lentisphaerota bacterium]
MIRMAQLSNVPARICRIASAAAALVSLCAAAASGAEALVPYSTGFEGGSLGAEWSVSGSGSASVQVGKGVQGNRGCAIADCKLNLAVTNAPAVGSNVWVRVFVKPVPVDETIAPTPATNAVAAFYISQSGVLKAVATNSYKDVASGMPTNVWMGFAVHLDYGAQAYDLYQLPTNSAYGAPMQRLNPAPLAFYTGATHRSTLQQVAIESSSTGYVDAVAIGVETGMLSVAQYVRIDDRPAGKSTMTAPPPYEYSGSAATMAGRLGDDMKRGSADGDVVRFLTTNGWKNSQLNVGAWQVPNDVEIPHGQSVLIDRRANSRDSVAFYPYNTAPTNAVQMIFDDGTPVKLGWNNLVWPAALGERGQSDGAGWHFDAAANGDKLWIYRDGQYVVLKYDSGDGKWKEIGVRTESAVKLRPGETFWYKRVASTYPWNPSN